MSLPLFMEGREGEVTNEDPFKVGGRMTTSKQDGEGQPKRQEGRREREHPRTGCVFKERVANRVQSTKDVKKDEETNVSVG